MEPKKETAPTADHGLVLPEKQKPAKIEVNRELAALGAKAAEVDKLAGAGTVTGTGKPAAGPGAPAMTGAQQPTAPPDTVAEVKLVIGIARPAVEMLIPYLRGADQSSWDALVEPTAALCAHYGISLGAWMESPWARLAGAAVPLAMHGFMKWQAEQAGKGKPAALPGSAPVIPPAPPVQEGKPKETAPAPGAAGGVDIKL